MPKSKTGNYSANSRSVSEVVSFFKAPEGSLILVILIIAILLSLTTDSFLTTYNIGNVFKQAAITGIIALAALIIIISGGIDLSIGAISGLSSMILALSLIRLPIPVFLSITISIITGTLIGLYNGIIIHETRIPSFIATLGTMTIAQGITKLISGGKTITGLPFAFTRLGNIHILGIHIFVYIWAAIVVLCFFVLKYLKFGRHMFAIGSSIEVARLSGINLRKNIYGIYAFAGFLCSISGVLLTLRLFCAVPTGGEGYNLTGIAAAVIGGASLSGATGSVQGTVCGTILMVLIRNGGVHLNIPSFVMEIVTGILITLAVIMDRLRSKNKE